MTLLRVAHSGGRRISADHFAHPVAFTFKDREVLDISVSGASPPGLRDLILHHPEIQISGSTITLPKISLSRGDKFDLFVLSSGSGRDVEARAHIQSGTFRIRGRPPEC